MSDTRTPDAAHNYGQDYNYVYNYTGAGVHVYILDTGITPNAEYGNRLAGDGVDFTTDNNPYLDHGHDSHGDVMASAAGGTTYGVAKCVTLHSVKISRVSEANIEVATQAINWVTAHGQKPGVINISSNFSGTATQKQYLNTAAQNAVAAGFFLINSAGDGGDGTLTGGSACTTGDLATVPEVFVVGGWGYVYSQHGPCVDLLADGTSVFGIVPGGTFTGVQGTSGSAALVAGAAALVLQQWPAATPNQVGWELVARSTRGAVTDGWSADSPNRLLYTRPIGYSEIPSTPASVSFIQHCGNLFQVSVTRGTVNAAKTPTYYEVQASSSSAFTYPTTGTADAGDSIDFAKLIVPTGVASYFRARACNMYGCSAYVAAPPASPGC